MFDVLTVVVHDNRQMRQRKTERAFVVQGEEEEEEKGRILGSSTRSLFNNVT